MEAWRLVVLLPDRIPSEGADRVSVDTVCKHCAWPLVLEAVDVYTKNQQAWADFEDQAVRSYEQMQTTGMHVTLDEMRAWSKELKTNPNASLPLCHK